MCLIVLDDMMYECVKFSKHRRRANFAWVFAESSNTVGPGDAYSWNCLQTSDKARNSIIQHGGQDSMHKEFN
jgi:hypothetical protein